MFKLLECLSKKDKSQRDEVLIPGYTCYSVAAAVAKANLKITVYDLDPKTFYPELDSIEKSVSEKTLAVVTQHLFGLITPLVELKKISHKYGAYLIEDAAQALGNLEGCKTPGTTGDFGLFSFGRGKPLPVGSGGALVTTERSGVLNEISLGPRNKGYRQVAIFAATQIISKPAFYWIPEMLPLGLGDTLFDPDFHVENITDAVESTLVNAMKILNGLNIHRKSLSDIYSENIDSKFQVQNRISATSIVRFPVMLPNAMLTKRMKQLGIRRMYPKAIYDDPAIKPYLKHDRQPTPGSVEIAKKLFTLPTHTGIHDEAAKYLSIMVQKAIKSD